ncbi:MAG TPA: hypothetical protein VHS09_04845, partial [Polyangiaceae bacterium]|nr:hypothetical protein [Polyangiaceae bacterium]
RAIATPLAMLFDRQILWHPLATKLSSLPRLLTGAHGVRVDLALLAPAVLLAAYGIVSRRRERKPSAVACPAAFVAAALFAVYLAAPYSVNFGAFLYVRFLAPAFAVAVLAAAPGRLHVAAKVVAACVPAATVAVALPQFAAASASCEEVDALLARMAPDSAVDVLHVGKRDKALLFEPTGAGNRALAVHGGRLAFSFAEYPIAPVVVPPAFQWNDTLLRLYADPTSLRPSIDLDRFRYVLVHGGEPPLTRLVEQALLPDARLAGVAGEWTLFESTHTVVPLTAKDSALPPEPPPTLQERVHALVRPPAAEAPAP